MLAFIKAVFDFELHFTLRYTAQGIKKEDYAKIKKMLVCGVQGILSLEYEKITGDDVIFIFTTLFKVPHC